jgi:hypothetical protein
MSTLYVDNLQPNLGSGVSIPGHVVQVLQTVKSDTLGFASSSFTDLAGLSVTITPKSSSSKILVTCAVHFTVSSDNYSIAYRILRDSTAVGIGDADGNRLRASFMDNQTGGGDHQSSSCFTFLDSPNTTSAVTYKIQAASELGASSQINRNQNANNDSTDPKYARPSSTITVMEIAQ